MVYVVLLLWLILGLLVFFVAMRRGSGRGGVAGGGEGLPPESKASRRLTILGVTLLVAFGLAIPALVLADNGNHKASVAVGGVHLTPAQTKGRELFARSCVYCHSLAAVRSYARTGPDLDARVGEEISTNAGRRALVLNAIMEGRARGLGQMPAGLYQGKEAEDVAAFVAAVAGR
jgi:mono/diheme cytochrome c family protein